ncbi:MULTISPECIES: hypothetical protein [Bacillus]|uniref:Uncharacterized protein n=2 Tax=Bacillus cereus group TaxID=86661 RepID=A0A2A7DE27_BACAN|nr:MULTISPECIES: hypothetical protein [Bacillus]MDC7973587.1 hypothetical protein [Bacillus sp. BLCC-B18]OTW67597.1 hypothetical protein BK707_20745 [Bacillus thuringiensis serovar coreanensis]OTX44214.1 hypothetical protein BK724_16040 [Bacillus thuringiensis serovar sooncheon]OTX53377.1 hypothetical protein BK725_14425 [Bacillus thuringiensis serovar guiyangiensis]OTX67698.1 hypothetical protein BK727_15445 [Bacillus thuringiensis serovar roskildiensis]
MKNKRCDNCGSTTFKEGRVGAAYHAYVCADEPSRFFSRGKQSKLLTTFCLERGEVKSFRVENPERFEE